MMGSTDVVPKFRSNSIRTAAVTSSQRPGPQPDGTGYVLLLRSCAVNECECPCKWTDEHAVALVRRMIRYAAMETQTQTNVKIHPIIRFCSSSNAMEAKGEQVRRRRRRRSKKKKKKKNPRPQ
ncbi:hypothetical protein RB195_007532 [Necator americanus]|uniref:Uncharacterized protein n=1 Tax=Necator americanus TaxID=51031 RepID=A0ABR1C065_NECAM